MKLPPTQNDNILSNIQVKSLHHLGLVAAAIERLNLVNKLDARLRMSENSRAKISHGQCIKAMIINGLGYVRSPLYMTERFFSDKDTERLIAPGVEAAHLGDHTLGRTLDAIHKYGTSKLFAEVAFEIADEKGLLGTSLHVDSTTYLLHGEFGKAIEQANKRGNENIPAHGYSKAHRPDLLQVVMSLTVSGKSAMPLWFEGLPGNSSDKSSFHETIANVEAFKAAIGNAESFLWVADSALYTAGKLKNINVKWLTRVPHTLAAVKTLMNTPSDDLAWIKLDDDYKTVTYPSLLSGQKCVLYFSKALYAKEEKSLLQRIQKDEVAQSKKLKKLEKTVFGCEADALKAAQDWRKKLKYHDVEFTINTEKRYDKPGKPAKDAEPDRIEYQLQGSLAEDEQKQAIYFNRLGRFMLATNDTSNLDMDAVQMLSTYKEQDKVERGFRFIKSDEFQLDHIFLKTPERIEALMMVMALTLMVYNSSEYQMRETMAAQEITLPNQKGKATAKPTLRWVFELMQGITQLNVPGMGCSINGLDEHKVTIAKLFGKEACEIYGITL